MRMRMIALVAAVASCGVRASTPAYPAARQDNVHETLHGVDIVDPYRWLEDQASPETRAWIDAENAYTHALLDPYPGRAAIHARLTALMRVDDHGVPVERGGRYFSTRRRVGDDLEAICVRTGASGEDAVLVDPHPLSPDHTTSVGLEDIAH